MIRSFKDKETEIVFRGKASKKFPPQMQRIALRKLLQLNYAKNLNDLRDPPGNRLEKFTDDREERWSIRINDQWRLRFRWDDNGPYDAEIIDYH